MVRFAIIGLVASLLAMASAQGLFSFAARASAPRPVEQVVVADPQPQPDTADAGDASIAKSPDGHYWANAQVNGQQVHFLVDTGATAVALTADDARRLGFAPESLTYNYTVSTASGMARAAEVKLDIVSVGRAQVLGVDAFVIDRGLQTSLLGMTYLGRLSKFEATPQALVLRS
jgi:aspartyl protease family protein